MARTGFRLFKVQLFAGQSRRQFERVDERVGDMRTATNVLFTKNLGQKFGAHRNAVDIAYRLAVATEVGTNAIFGELHFGSFDEYKFAMTTGPKDLDISLAGTAPSQIYRFALMFPDTGGSTGLLAMEVRARTCPTSILTGALRDWSQAMKDVDVVAGGYLRMQLEPTVDAHMVAKYLEQAEVQQVQLRTNRRDRAGVPKSHDLTVITQLVDAQQPAARKALAKIWSSSKLSGGARPTSGMLLTQVKQFFPASIDLNLFDNAVVVLDHPDAGRKTFDIGDADEYFTYVIEPGNRDVGDEEFIGAMQKSVASVTFEDEVDLDPLGTLTELLEAAKNGKVR